MSHLQLTTYGDVSPSTFEMDFAAKLLETQDLYDNINNDNYTETYQSSRQYYTQRSSPTNSENFCDLGDTASNYPNYNTSPSNSSTHEGGSPTHTSFHSSLHDTKYYPMGDVHYPMTTMRFQIGSPPRLKESRFLADVNATKEAIKGDEIKRYFNSRYYKRFNPNKWRYIQRFHALTKGPEHRFRKSLREIFEKNLTLPSVSQRVKIDRIISITM